MLYSFSSPEIVELPLDLVRAPEGNEVILTRNVESFDEIGERLGVAFGVIRRFDAEKQDGTMIMPTISCT